MRDQETERRGSQSNNASAELLRIRSFRRHGDVDALIAELASPAQDPPIVVRGAAARALGHLGDTRATRPLLKLLDDDNEGVRATAAQALGELGDNAAASVLRRSASEDPSPVVRSWAAHALGSMRDRQAVPVLIVSLRDDDFRVRRAAAVALANIGDERAIPPLERARAAEPWWRRRALTKACRTIARRHTTKTS